MTTAQPVRVESRRTTLGTIASFARAAMFAGAVGVFLSAPPSLPWVIALVAVTNVVFLVTRAAMANIRPPAPLLLLNGLTITLVIVYAALSSVTS